MIRNIIFDLGGVLLTNGTRIFAEKLSREHSLAFSEVLKEINDTDGAGAQYRTGAMNRDQFWQFIISKFSIKENADNLENKWISCYELNEKTADLIKKLKNKYRIFYLSNSVKERITKLNQRFGLTSFFEGGVFSHEVGVRKPEVETYQIILQKYDLKPEESIFIDDKEKNLPPAEELGIKTILFKSAESLSSELNNFLKN